MFYQLPAQTGYILHEEAASYYGAGTGWLSIKSFFHGNAQYAVGRGRYVVGDTAYLVLNHGQPYTIMIEAERPVESFCVFFAPGFAERVQSSLIASTDQQLSGSQKQLPQSIAFFERTHLHDAMVSPALLQLRRACVQHAPEQGWLIEQFHGIMQRLLYVHAAVRAEVEAIPAIRAATREELYRRLYYAKDYADALFDTAITIHDLADVAGLSTNHFLRTFKQVFHLSPYQYITARRLEHAQQLLRHTEQPVTEICFAVGFESLSAFSWRFRQRLGVSPQQYRQQKR